MYVQLINSTSFMGKKVAFLKQALALIYFSFLPMLLMSNFERDFNLLSQKLEDLGKHNVLFIFIFFQTSVRGFCMTPYILSLSVIIDSILFANITPFQHASMIKL